jgi:uncharacterized membrane protein YdjX (TVP38/TMEM64 family)
VKPWIVYTLIRVGIFAASFALLYGVFAIEPWLAAVIAAVIGLTISYIFFRPQRDAAVQAFVTKSPAAKSDEEAED